MRKRIFSKRKYIQDVGEKDYQKTKFWVDVCDGEEVVNGKMKFMNTTILSNSEWELEINE